MNLTEPYLIAIFVYSVIYLYITNWHQIHYLLFSFLFKRQGKEKLVDKKIIIYIKQKTGIQLEFLTILNSGKLFAAAPPFQEKTFILTRRMYKTFSEGELHYIALHEAAHIKFRHGIKTLTTFVYFLSMGILLLVLFPYQYIILFVAIVLGIIFSIATIGITHGTEREAEIFAAEHIEKKEYMISAVKKLTRKNSAGFWSEKYPFRKFLVRNILPSEKLRIANLYGKNK